MVSAEVSLFVADEYQDLHFDLLAGKFRNHSKGYIEICSGLLEEPWVFANLNYRLERFNIHELKREYQGCLAARLCKKSGFRTIWRYYSRSLLDSIEDFTTMVSEDSGVVGLDFPSTVTHAVYIVNPAVNYHAPTAPNRRHPYEDYMDWWNNGGATGKLKDSIDGWESYGSLVREWGRTE